MDFEIIIRQTGRKFIFDEIKNKHIPVGDIEDQGFILVGVNENNIQEKLKMLICDAKNLNYDIQNIIITNNSNITNSIGKILDNL